VGVGSAEVAGEAGEDEILEPVVLEMLLPHPTNANPPMQPSAVASFISGSSHVDTNDHTGAD
jgi:hypothetical protein